MATFTFAQPLKSQTAQTPVFLMLHHLRQPLVSIIVPCYNHGAYIDEMLESIETISDKNLFEVIIVNDGSPDAYTNERIEAIAATGLYDVTTQPNAGVAVARNNALSRARGKYILPVDSDNRISADFIYKGVAALEGDPDIAIVYCDSRLFGDEEGIRKAGEFNLQRLMLGNFIDNCSLYRKEMVDKIGGYDLRRELSAIADWELWLRASFNSYKFHYIAEPLFDYRVLADSMANQHNASKKKWNDNMKYLADKFPYHYGPQYIDENITSKLKASPSGFIGKLILKAFFPKKFAAKVADGTLRQYI